jgi:predicted ATPase
MLVAISGAQGSGKSTVLSELAKIGYKTIERKSARSVMTEKFPGMKLDDIYADPNIAVRWQEAILERKIFDETSAIHSKELWFTERTYADLFTYAVMAIGKNNLWSDWLDDYYQRCWDNNKLYHHTFYLTSGHFNPVPDGVRGINKHYQAMIDNTLQRISFDMLTNRDEAKFDMTHVQVKDINQRVELIQHKLLKLKEEE